MYFWLRVWTQFYCVCLLSPLIFELFVWLKFVEAYKIFRNWTEMGHCLSRSRISIQLMTFPQSSSAPAVQNSKTIGIAHYFGRVLYSICTYGLWALLHGPVQKPDIRIPPSSLCQVTSSSFYRSVTSSIIIIDPNFGDFRIHRSGEWSEDFFFL